MPGIYYFPAPQSTLTDRKASAKSEAKKRFILVSLVKKMLVSGAAPQQGSTSLHYRVLREGKGGVRVWGMDDFWGPVFIFGSLAVAIIVLVVFLLYLKKIAKD